MRLRKSIKERVMAIINGTKGTHGTNGGTPTIGGPGSNESFTQNGKIGADSLTEQVFAGDGGDGGNGTGAAAGANGGNGGNAAITLNGNIFNAPATNNLTVALTAVGGNGGLGGTSVNFTPGLLGNGGNATVTMSGNIIQPNKIMNTIELDAIAIAGDGTKKGNASATINGNIIQPSKATTTVTLLAEAYANGTDAYANNGNLNYGTKTATINGNIVQGNVNNVYLSADTYNPATPFIGSNGTATINGNVIQTKTTNTGFVSLEASGQHIAITQNKITLGLQELDLAVNQFGPTYDTQIKTNEFKGTGTNTFSFTDNVYPGPHTPDTIAIDLGAGTFMFNGDSNTLTGFANATVWGNNAATILGSNAINILTGGNGDDTISGLGGNDFINGSGGNDLLTGGAGNDTIDGGAGLFDTAVYSGARAQYTLSFINTGNLAGTVTDTVPGRDGTDTLTNVEFLKFSDGLYDVVNGTFSTNNHAPVAVADTYSVLEDNVLTVPALTGVLANDTDADSDPLTSVLVTNAANGNVVLNANGSFTYTPNANFNGADSFTYKANDGISDSAPVTVTLNVTSVNDAPSGADKLITTLEDTSYTFTASDFGFTDPNDSPANALFAVKITTLPAAGTLLDNGVAVTPGQFVSAADIAGGLLTFAPAASANGAGYANFTFQVQDNGGTANGGIDLDASPNTITVNVTSVNDAPAGADKLITTLEDTSYTFTASDFGFTDPNDSPANALAAVRITTLPVAGTLLDNGVAVTAGQSVSAADIAGGLLTFAPAANANGAGYANFTFQVQDNGGTANGGVDLDASPNTITFNVTSVNDAPAGADDIVTTLQNTPYTFAASDFGFTDPNDTPANALLAVKISTLPAAGTLTDNGVPVTAGQFVSLTDIAGGLLKFTPAVNASGPGYASFTFQVQDNGGTANGGVDLDQSPNSMTINVTPVGLFVGPGGYATINAAIAAANPGDTIMIAPGTYNENVVVNKSVTLQGTGPGVVIEGTFTEDNGNFAGPLSTWLQTAPGYSGASGTGISVSADNVTLKNLTVDDFLTGVDVSGPSVSGLTLDGVTTQHSVNGFSKPDDTALNGTTITNSTFQDEYIGAGFFNDQGATGGAGFGKDATDTTITNSHFQDIDIKGVYMETAQGTTLLDGLTMDNVGQYGGVPSFGANGQNGNGIDLNLKYHTYTGDVTISNFDLTNTGGSAGQNGAIVVEGRDDAPSYSGIPADVSGLNVTIQDGTIDGTSTGIRAGENKANPAQNDTGPAVTIQNVNILNAPQGQIDNHTNSLMTVNGTNGDDTYQSAQTAGSTGPILFYGNGGNDYLLGGLGDDIFVGGTGDDTLDGGTGGIDTANYSDATQDGLIVNLLTGMSSGGGLGNDTLYNIRNLTGSSFADTLVGDDGDNLLVGGDGNDKLYGHAGNNTLVGGNDTDVAYYSGLETQYSTVNLGAVIGGPDAVNDTLIFVERLKFLSPSHVSDVDNNGTGERIFQNNTTGDLQIQDLGVSVNGVGGVNWRAVGTGQFNPDADRQSDILLQDTTTGDLKVITDLTGAQTQTMLSIQPGAAAWKAVAIGDFNGDAASDVLLQNQTTGAAEIMFLNTNSTDAVGTVAGPAVALATPGAGWKAISSGDFNGDGKSDILWQNTASKAVKVYEMNGSDVINAPATQAAAGLTAIGTGDFNGDGNSDILFQNVAGQAVVWFMYGDIHTGTKTVAKPAGTWSVSGAQDVDGNGYSDIIWNNAATDATTATTFGGPASLVSTTVLNPNMGLPTAGNSFHLIASTGGG
jgi:VCBS repeat-containing protein